MCSCVFVCQYMCAYMFVPTYTPCTCMYAYTCTVYHFLVRMGLQIAYLHVILTDWIKAPPTHCCMCCSLIPRPWCGGGGTRLHVLLPPHPPNCLSLHSRLGSAATRTSIMCISICCVCVCVYATTHVDNG